MATGHWKSAMVREFVACGVPEALQGGPLPAEEIALRCSLDPEAGKRFLRAAEGMGLLESAGTQYQLSSLGKYLDKSSKDSLAYTVLLESSIPHVLGWTGLGDFIKTGNKSVKSTLNVENYWELFNEGGAFPGHINVFSKAMSTFSTIELSSIMQSKCDFSMHKSFADIGGSEGQLLFGIMESSPGSTGIVVDLPDVVKRVNVPAGLEGRVETKAGSFFDGSAIPVGVDAYLLKHIIHDWDDEPSVQILSNIVSAMKKDAALYVFEMIVPDEDGEDMSKMFDLHMGVLLNGKERTVGEFKSLFDKAGLDLVEVHRTVSQIAVLKTVKK